MVRVKRKPLTPCEDVLPGSEKVVIIFQVGGEYRVGNYRPETNMFHSAGSPEIKFRVEEVTGWKPLMKNPEEYVNLLRKAVNKEPPVELKTDSPSYLVDLSLTGRRRKFKK